MAGESAPTPQRQHGGLSYWSLVWGQLKKNKPALVSLIVIVLLFLVAAWAPLLAEGRPLVWVEKGETSYPLFDWLTAPTSSLSVDYLFNFFMLATLTLPVIGLIARWLYRRRDTPQRYRSRYVLATLGLGFAMAALPFIGPGSYERTPSREEKEFDPSLKTVTEWHVLRRYKLNRRNYLADSAKLDSTQGERAIFPPIRQDPLTQSADVLQTPGPEHILGTDNQGRDVLARMLHGGRISLAVGFVAVGIATLIGIILGGLAGYYRGWVDIAISRFIELIICFPSFFLIITIIAVIENRSILHVMLVIGFTSWPGLARLVRGEFLKLADQDFVHAARALGCGGTRIMFRHILPNALGPVLVSVAFAVAGAVLTESSLSYLGFGSPPPTPTWGEMISQGKTHIFEGAWWLLYFPGKIIFLTVVVYNLAGDGLRDAMDPKMRK